MSGMTELEIRLAELALRKELAKIEKALAIQQAKYEALKAKSPLRVERLK